MRNISGIDHKQIKVHNIINNYGDILLYAYGILYYNRNISHNNIKTISV